jgi:hypothetical protein
MSTSHCLNCGYEYKGSYRRDGGLKYVNDCHKCRPNRISNVFIERILKDFCRWEKNDE